MSQQILEHVSKKHLKNTPDIKAGYTVRVHQRIKEGEKERVQIFEGLVIKVQGSGITKTITVRKVVSGVGVEKIFPIHSDNIVKVEIKKMGKVRRAKLYYMRERSGKSARLKEQHVDIAVDIEHLHTDEPTVAEEEPTTTESEAPTTETAPTEEAASEEKAEETPADEAPATDEESKDDSK